MSCEECRKVEVDLVGEQKPVAQVELNKAKNDPPNEIVDTKGKDLYLLVGVGIFLFGGLLFPAILNPIDMSGVSDLNVLDENVLRNVLSDFEKVEITLPDGNVISTTKNQMVTDLLSGQIRIETDLIALQVQHLCGSNLLVEDSNRLVENEQGAFVTYSCYAKIGEAT